jgi:hypothetical protein
VIGLSLPHAKQEGVSMSELISSSYSWSDDENSILRIFGPKRDEIMGGLRQFHKLCNLYSLPDIIRMTKSKRMRWARHVAHGGRGSAYRVWVKKLKEKTTRNI